MEKVFGARENAANLIVIRRRRRETNSSNLLPGHKAYTQGNYGVLFIKQKCLSLNYGIFHSLHFT